MLLSFFVPIFSLKKEEERETKMGDRSCSQDMVKAVAQTIKNWTPTSPLPFANIQMRKETFFFLQYQISERRVFFQDWMARKTGSILDKEHVNYFFYSLYSLSKLLPA